jgi:hypothetical protein
MCNIPSFLAISGWATYSGPTKQLGKGYWLMRWHVRVLAHLLLREPSTGSMPSSVYGRFTISSTASSLSLL